MAAGTFTVFDVFKADLGTNADIGSSTILATVCSAAWTPNLATDLSASAGTSPLTSATVAVLASVVWSAAGSNTYQFDFANPVYSLTNVTAMKYFVVYRKTSNRLVGYVDLNVGVASGVDATTLTVNVHADGAFTLV